MVITIERDNFTDNIRDRSLFEESAANKISDTRTRDSTATDVRTVTAHSMAESKSITEKLAAYKTTKAVTTNTEFGKNVADLGPKMRSSVGKGGQIRPELSETGSTKNGKKPATGKPDKPRTDKYGNIIPSRISSKAKGNEETKAKNIGKTKNLRKDTIVKKAEGVKTETGKFQQKIGTDRRKTNKGKIKSAAVTAVDYKLGTSTEDDRNGSTEAIRAGIRGASYLQYSKYNRRRNNINAQKFLYKSNVYKGAKIGEEARSRTTGKYGRKADANFLRIQANRKKERAAKLAMEAKKAKKFRQAREKEKKAVHTFEEVKQKAIKVAKKLVEFARRNAALIISISTCITTFIVISAGVGSCAMAFTSGTETYMAGLSGALDPDMTDCDNYFGEKEMLLQEKIDKIEEDYPDYDEYVFDTDEIGHDPLKLMAYLSAVYDSYDLSIVKAKLDEIFNELYELTLEPKTEQRTRQKFNQNTGKYEDEIYDVQVLYVTLKKKDWDDIISTKFPDSSSKERYEIYDDTDGAHQAFYNPFETDWSTKITSRFGWRIHPILGGEKFHNGIDIGMPEGTEIHACATGKVITATYSESAGNYVVIQDETGYTTHYMHMTSYNVSVGDEVKHGDIIGKVGSTGRSTGPHLHLGVKDAAGNWLNPEFLVSTYTGGSH